MDVAQEAQVVVGGVGAGQPDDELPAHHRFEAHGRFEAHTVLLRRMPAVIDADAGEAHAADGQHDALAPRVHQRAHHRGADRHAREEARGKE